ncbi:hypothetical protein GFS31_10450 [Leptolyngbya sp. BL0902]|nr:hypothetical protein GFS31_10450 [Leptolyngbya sp. BL0902]
MGRRHRCRGNRAVSPWLGCEVDLEENAVTKCSTYPITTYPTPESSPDP